MMILCHKHNNKYVLTISSLGNVTLSFQMLSTRRVHAALFSAAMWNCFHSLNHTMIEMFRERSTETDTVQLKFISNKCCTKSLLLNYLLNSRAPGRQSYMLVTGWSHEGSAESISLLKHVLSAKYKALCILRLWQKKP